MRFLLGALGTAILVMPVWASDSEAVASIIKKHNQAHLQAILDGDAEQIAKLHTLDAIQLYPGSMAQGRFEILGRQQEIFKHVRVVDGAIVTKSLKVSGDMACEVGEFRYVLEAKSDGRQTSATGKYLAVWHKQADGSWQIHADAGLPNTQ